MRILMLAWEYPPKSVGGLSNHVYYLSQQLNNMGNEVHVITCGDESLAAFENDEGVFVHRAVPYDIHTDDFVKWVMHLNYAMIEEGIRVINKYGTFGIIHAHDWLSVYAAKVLKKAFCIPMVCTFHATEYGRNNGIKTEVQRYISSAEWMLSYEAWKIVVCSEYMRKEVQNVFGVPWEKMWLIPNGINSEVMDFEFDWINFRRQFAADNEKIVLYVGRHVHEKGIFVLVDAAREIVEQYSDVKFIIVGQGPCTEQIKDKINDMGLGGKFILTGYVDLETKNKLLRVANAAVFPSLYEPFGIVALEAMAAKCPAVVSDVGGLSEIVTHKETGMKIIPGSPQSLASNVVEVLKDEGLANYIKEKAYELVKDKYSWRSIAELTYKMYETIRDEAEETDWEK